ncbi:unnamed protein product [Lactuca virosa]|uniref:Uncharacterized protein n=1 Tax=Lactuca virosa TaxID=75947 RepID=A0AAU9NSI2_9ASTR|nr:unnamed protein product [Lactuca virosa]
MDFSSYLCLVELDMEGLRQLCCDPDAEGDHLKGDSSETGLSSNPAASLLLVPGSLCWLFWVRILHKG